MEKELERINKRNKTIATYAKRIMFLERMIEDNITLDSFVTEHKAILEIYKEGLRKVLSTV